MWNDFKYFRILTAFSLLKFKWSLRCSADLPPLVRQLQTAGDHRFRRQSVDCEEGGSRVDSTDSIWLLRSRTSFQTPPTAHPSHAELTSLSESITSWLGATNQIYKLDVGLLLKMSRFSRPTSTFPSNCREEKISWFPDRLQLSRPSAGKRGGEGEGRGSFDQLQLSPAYSRASFNFLFAWHDPSSW